MLHTLDIFTLGLCSVLASGAFGIVFLALWLRRRSERHLFHWAASNGLYALVLLALASPVANSLVSRAALFALMSISNLLVVSGVFRLDGKRALRNWMIIPVIAATAGFVLPVLAGVGAGAALADVSEALGLATAMTICGVAVLHEPGEMAASRGRKIAGLALLAYVPGYLAVIAIRLGFPQSSDLLPRIPMLCDQLLLGVLNLSLLAIPAEQSHERLRLAAWRDPLTGAWNREGLVHLAARFLGAESAVIAIDIDNFKAINDGHGHSAGDNVLSAVARMAEHVVAERGGAVFRIGGDEFVVIVPNCDRDEGERIAERMRQCGEKTRQSPRWTLSMGIALIGRDVPPIEEAIKRADTALYRAKSLGRDRAHLIAA